MSNKQRLHIDEWPAAWGSDPSLARQTLAWVVDGALSQEPQQLFEAILPRLLNLFAGAGLAVVSLQGGAWRKIATAGTWVDPPWNWLGEVLDREQAQDRPPWHAAPLDGRNERGELLVLHAGDQRPGPAGIEFPAWARLLGRLVDAARRRHDDSSAARRLRAILDEAGAWYRIRDMESLLVRLAQSATRLLGADRASIFLWDRANRVLVGRPALGVEEQELRIPDDSGVVGRVVKSGQPQRVDSERDQALIDRRTDRRLGYQTQTLLCVPMRGERNDVIGAFEAINKGSGNFTAEDEATLAELAAHASIAVENTQDREQLLRTRRQISEQAAQGIQFVGNSPAIAALRSTIRRVAITDLAVLILGENGTGKEVVAQSIHYGSERRDQPFIAINCAALPDTLLESELFGHERGAFTDAHESRPGKFELASGGTLFLDEIGDLSLSGQAKLLRVVEEKLVVRVGGSKAIATDARLIAATNQDLAAMVREKRFRQDLFYRLNVVALTLPPLRERGEDITRLAEHFLHDFSCRARRAPPRLSAAARQRLETHRWPGNVRELRNVMERIAYLVPNDQIEAEDLTMLMHASPEGPTMDLDMALNEATNHFQRQYIEQAMQRAAGNMSRAAELLGLHRSNLYRKMRQLDMNVGD